MIDSGGVKDGDVCEGLLRCSAWKEPLKGNGDAN